MYVAYIYIFQYSCSQEAENNLFTIPAMNYRESKRRGIIPPAQQEIK